MKQCPRCKQTKPIEQFYRNKSNRDGHAAYCVPCAKASVNLWVAKHPADSKKIKEKYYHNNIEKVRASHRRYAASPIGRAKTRAWKKAHIEQVRAEAREYVRTHRAQCLENGRRWYKNNPEAARAKGKRRYAKERQKPYEERPWIKNAVRCAANLKQWRKENPVKTYLQRVKRRYRQRKNPGKCTATQLQARINFYGELCWRCNKPFQAIDHVIPLVKGGTNFPANLRTICKRCNSSKGAKHPRDLPPRPTIEPCPLPG